MRKSKEKNTETSSLEETQSIPTMMIGNKIVSSQNLTLEDEIELERRQAFIEPETRDVLRNWLQIGDNHEIVPTYSARRGYYYKITDAADTKEFIIIPAPVLQKLAHLSILKQSFFESAATCPNCESLYLTFHDRCPKCKSHNVQKASLTEHLVCGYINQRDTYTDDICPQCGEKLIEGQYRNMGRWYLCQNCGDRFENPENDLVCHNCDKSFAIKEAKPKQIPKYSFNPERVKEIRQNVASLEDLQSLLSRLGFNVEIPGLAFGEKSGMQHHFSLIAKKEVNGKDIVIGLDHATSDSEVQASPLILYIYKTSEVKIDIPIFIAVPSLNETAKKIAQGHDILLIEGSTDQKGMIEHIKQEIENRITQKAPSLQTQKTRNKKRPQRKRLHF